MELLSILSPCNDPCITSLLKTLSPVLLRFHSPKKQVSFNIGSTNSVTATQNPHQVTLLFCNSFVRFLSQISYLFSLQKRILVIGSSISLIMFRLEIAAIVGACSVQFWILLCFLSFMFKEGLNLQIRLHMCFNPLQFVPGFLLLLDYNLEFTLGL